MLTSGVCPWLKNVPVEAPHFDVVLASSWGKCLTKRAQTEGNRWFYYLKKPCAHVSGRIKIMLKVK